MPKTEADSQMMSLFPCLIMVQSESDPLLQTRKNEHIIAAMKQKKMHVHMFYVEYNNHFNLIGNLFGCEVIVPHNVKSTYKYETTFLNVKTASSAFSRPTNEQKKKKKKI